MKYPITNIFYSLQGEGHFVGYPMAFIRLAGCSVRECHIRQECDEAPWKAKEGMLSVEEILSRVSRASGVVCVTGGEPTDHDLLPLIEALRHAGLRVHMETSGVRAVVGYPLEWLTVSPKVRGSLRQRTGHTLKIVVRPEWTDEEAWSVVDEFDAGTDFFHRYLQPMTILGTTNVAQVARMLLSEKNTGRWALSAQSHRSWGLP